MVLNLGCAVGCGCLLLFVLIIAYCGLLCCFEGLVCLLEVLWWVCVFSLLGFWIWCLVCYWFDGLGFDAGCLLIVLVYYSLCCLC